MRPRPLSIALAVLVVVGAMSSSSVSAATLVSIASETRHGRTTLDLRFDGEAPSHRVARTDDGSWRATLSACDPAEGLSVPGPVRLGRDGGATILDFAPREATLHHVEATTTEIRLSWSGEADGTAGQYRLGAGDVISISVYEDKSLSDDYTVGQDGNINMPLIGAVATTGLTEAGLAERLRDRLSDYLESPTIAVTIRSFQSQSVYVNVTGDAPRALKIPLRPGMDLTDVLSEAGIALLPGQAIELRRVTQGGPRTSVRLTSEAIDTPEAPRPSDGDIVVVGEPNYVYIRGEVQQPGRFLHRPDLTLQQLIALARGLSEWANRREVRIQRVDGETGSGLEVDLRRIENGKMADVVLEPGDLVLVRRRTL